MTPPFVRAAFAGTTSSTQVNSATRHPSYIVGAATAIEKRAVAALATIAIPLLNFYWEDCDVRNWFIADLKIS